MNEQTFTNFMNQMRSDPLTLDQWEEIDRPKQEFIRERLKRILAEKNKLIYEEEKLREGRFVNRKKDVMPATQARIKKAEERKADKQNVITETQEVNEIDLGGEELDETSFI